MSDLPLPKIGSTWVYKIDAVKLAEVDSNVVGQIRQVREYENSMVIMGQLGWKPSDNFAARIPLDVFYECFYPYKKDLIDLEVEELIK